MKRFRVRSNATRVERIIQRGGFSKGAKKEARGKGDISDLPIAKEEGEND